MNKITKKYLPVKPITVVAKGNISALMLLQIKREEPEIFSKMWEWEQMCNHSID